MPREGARTNRAKALGWIVGILVDVLVTILIPGSSFLEAILAFLAGVAAYFFTTRVPAEVAAA
jgi:hypothetical protein